MLIRYNLVVEMENVYHPFGDVMVTMIVKTAAMSLTAIGNVK